MAPKETHFMRAWNIAFEAVNLQRRAIARAEVMPLREVLMRETWEIFE